MMDACRDIAAGGFIVERVSMLKKGLLSVLASAVLFLGFATVSQADTGVNLEGRWAYTSKIAGSNVLDTAGVFEYVVNRTSMPTNPLKAMFCLSRVAHDSRTGGTLSCNSISQAILRGLPARSYYSNVRTMGRAVVAPGFYYLIIALIDNSRNAIHFSRTLRRVQVSYGSSAAQAVKNKKNGRGRMMIIPSEMSGTF